MKVNFFDLTEQYEQVKEDIIPAIHKIFDTQKFILGENVCDFENIFAKYCGTKYCVAVSSGTDAILAALMALEIGVGDEVILPDFTFFATAGTVARTGAKPVFVDVEKDSFLISTDAIAKAITPKTKAIIPVHIFGQCADTDAIKAVAKNIPIIEDSAQGVGAEYKNGSKAGNLGLIGCFSFYPTKNLGGAGDSGAITTNDEALYNKLVQMRNHGMAPKYYHSFVGGNFRMDEIQAAVLLAKLPHIEQWNNLRRINHSLYRKYFIEKELVCEEQRNILCNENNVILPHSVYANSGVINFHTFHQYCVLVNKRDELKKFLADNEIGSDIYYPVPLHRQQCFSQYNYNDTEFPNTNYICNNILALPIYPELTEQQIIYVVDVIQKFYYKM
jgi:dTDP-4-amino-4,6-dideoxygalactose transaminase